jgi:catechol 2,3-dioxygenase-like lactoylglutathione lyase family enzyme
VIISHLDHLVLTVADMDATVSFYQQVMGMAEVSFGEARKALVFGKQKINLHQVGREFEPKARTPQPGSADLCFISETPLSEVIEHLHRCGVALLAGPVRRTGALGPIESVYFRDPDGNLIEVANQL